MRENMGLYRGKRKDNGEWVEGGIVVNGDYVAIVQYSDYHGWHEFIEVIPETIGECTGLPGKNGKLIFEGDICRMRCDGLSGYGEIQFRHGCFGIADKKRKRFYYLEDNSEYMVIGNIHDNPELLEVSGDE